MNSHQWKKKHGKAFGTCLLLSNVSAFAQVNSGSPAPKVPPSSVATPVVSPTVPSVAPKPSVPSSVPSVVPSPVPSVVPSPEAQPPAHKPPPPRAAWILEPAFSLSSQNEARTLVPPPSPSDAVESEKEEQFLLFSPQSGAAHANGLFYQRRFNSEQRFGTHNLGSENAVSSEVLRKMPQVFGSFVYCPLSQEILFQAPPMDASGKFLLNSKPSRVYLFSLVTGQLELIWRRPRDQFGTFNPKMSATPDCMHILVNQALETKGAKTPFGELVYLKRPSAKAGGRATVAQEWTSAIINSTNPNGVWSGFGEASFATPRDPQHYRVDQTPPVVFAITDMIDKSAKSPLVNIFTPSSGRKVVIAESVRWDRKRFEAPAELSGLKSPVFDNSGRDVFLLADNFRKSKVEKPASWIVSFDLQKIDEQMHVHVKSEDPLILSFDVRPQGDGFVFSFLRNAPSQDLEKLSDKKIAGVGVLTIQGKKFLWREVHRMFPFQGLEEQHHPSPSFGMGGNDVFFVDPLIGELNEPELYQLSSAQKQSKEIQFGAKLKKWLWADLKL